MSCLSLLAVRQPETPERSHAATGSTSMTNKPTTDLRPPPAEPDRTWFDHRPDRKHRLRLPSLDDIREFGRRITHIIAVRHGKTRISQVPVTLVAGADPLYLNTLIRLADIPTDGVLELELAEIVKASKAGRRINLEGIFFKASKEFR